MRRVLPLVVLLLVAAGAQNALGGTPGPLSADPDPINFHTIAANDSPTISVTITNTGGSQVTISDVGVSNGGGDLSASGCGSAVLNPNDTCNVSVTYSPTSGGSLDPGASLDITDDDATDPVQHFTINGSAVANRFQLVDPTPSPGFGTVAVGDTSNAKQVTVQNHTDFSADPNPHMTGPDAGDFHVTGCPSNVGGGNNCTASVTFSPSSQGPESATLQFDGASFDVTGTGAQPVDITPTSLPFGDQHVGTTSPAQPITVTNNHDQAITVNVGTAADYNVNDSDCTNQQLQGHAQCSILVVFSPNAVGPQNGTLTVEGQNVQLTGRGTAAVADVVPTSISFGNQPIFTQSANHIVTVTNSGNEDMHIQAPALAGPNAAEFSISDTCQAAAPLVPGDQCTITVTFNPTVQGALDAELQFNSDANNGQRTVQLHGTGTSSAVVFVPGPVPFKQPHHAGTFSTPRTITLTNRTSGPLTIAKVHLGGSNPHSFRITGGNCGGRTIAADASCTETVRFAPNEVGLKAATLIVNDDGPNGPHSVALTGKATYPKDDVGRSRRGRLRRDQDHVEAGRIVEPLRSHRHRPQPLAHPDGAQRRDAAFARRRRPARSRAQPLHGVRVPGVRPVPIPHPARDAQPLPRSGAAPADGRDLHADGRRRDHRHDADGLLAPAQHALRLLLPALPRRRPGGAEAIRARQVVHVPEPPAPASRLHVHALPLRVPAVPAGGHVDRAHHLPRSLAGYGGR